MSTKPEQERGTVQAPVGPWQMMLFGSGTTIVFLDNDLPHYYVWHPPDDDEGENYRHRIAKALETWLNGGDKPFWMHHMMRLSPDRCRTGAANEIQAVGPHGDYDKNGLPLKDPDYRIERGLLIDALMKGERPNPELNRSGGTTVPR